MGALKISLIFPSYKIKETTIFFPFTESELNTKQSFEQIENDYDIKQYIKITMRLNSNTETEVNTLVNQQSLRLTEKQ